MHRNTTPDVRGTPLKLVSGGAGIVRQSELQKVVEDLRTEIEALYK